MGSMKKYIFVQGDTNDADFVAQLTEIKGWNVGEEKMTQNDLIDLIKKVGKIVKKQKGHNWDMSEYCKDGESPEEIYKDKLTEEEIGIFNETYVPHGNGGIHRITEIKILEVVKEINII